jgi:hypothetical protein
VLASFAWLLLAVVVLLSVPIRLALVAEAQARPCVQLRASWLFGLVCGPLTASSAKPRKKRDKATKKTSSTPAAKRGLAFVRAAGGVPRLRNLVDDLVACLHPNVQWLRIELGLGDPADTSEAWVVLWPMSALLSYRYGGLVMLVPNFSQAALTVEGRADFTLVPLQALAILLGYVASPRTLLALIEARRSG